MKNIFLVIFIFSLSFIGCIDPFELSILNDSSPAGFGYFKMDFNETGARNIVPVNPVLNDVAVFSLRFVNADFDISEDIFSSGAAITLPVGTYNTFTVTAYKDAGKTQAFLYYEMPSGNTLTISSGTNTHSVNLIPFALDGTGTGFFTWNITLPPGLTEASIAIERINPTGTIDQTINFINAGNYVQLNNAANPVPLTSGYYRIIITLKRGENYQPLVHREALHIYRGMTSHFQKTFNLNDFNNWQYTVTFLCEKNSSYQFNSNVIYGEITVPPLLSGAPSFIPVAGLYLNGVPEHYSFENWYHGSSLTPFDFNTPITGNITLTAKWDVPGKITTVADNDIDAAVNYVNNSVNAAAGSYILLLESISAHNYQTVNQSDFDLTIRSIGDPLNYNASFALSNGNLTICNNFRVAGTIHVYPASKLSLSQSGSADSVFLYAQNVSTNSNIIINSGWTGNGSIISLLGQVSDNYETVAGYWDDKQILTGAGVNPASMAKFTLGSFVTSPTELIATTHELVFDSAANSAILERKLFSGSGTSNDPFIIRTEPQLRQMGRGSGDYSTWNETAHYKLANDITLTAGWSPVSAQFSGSLNGDGKTIDLGSFNNHSLSANNFGIFANLSGTVENLRLEGNITSAFTTPSSPQNIAIGTVAGINNGTIKNILSNVTININNGNQNNVQYIGGITGRNYGIITNCYNIGNIMGRSTGMNRVGGITGINEVGGTIDFCWNSAVIEGGDLSTRQIGGIAGRIEGGSITNCAVINSTIRTGNDAASHEIGRIVGNTGGGNLNYNFSDNVSFSKPTLVVTPVVLITGKDGDNFVSAVQANWVSNLLWTINPSKSTASPTSPWWWDVNRLRLWFE
ncbi:MAG: hypothetical protein FWD47_03140 [Treponema sp.]|nr:hypothetical protein [Treponema sp.]